MDIKKIIPCYILTGIVIIVGLTVDNLRTPALFFTLLSLFITLIFLLKVKRMLKVDMEQIIEFTENLASGQLKHKPFIEGGELKRLSDSLIQMAEKLKGEVSLAIESKKKIEMVLKNMKEGLLIVDQRGIVVLASNSIMDLLGVNSAVEMLPATEALRNADLILLLEEARASKQVVMREIQLRNDRFLSVTASPLETEVIMTFYDITRLKRLEQIRQDFVANVAHEIRTPITAIKGFAETLLDGAIEDRENSMRFLEIIKRHSERLNSLVNDLLTLSGIESGDIKLDIKDLNIPDVIDQIVSLIEERAKQKGLRLERSLPAQMPVIRADKDRLIQILLNLVDNAIKFTDLGSVTIGAEVYPDRIIIFVQDTGIGIEKRHLLRLGERFYRVDRARSRELGGTGLGLAIVKHLVKAHGWTMDIDSTPGKGTKVMILLPLSPSF